LGDLEARALGAGKMQAAQAARGARARPPSADAPPSSSDGGGREAPFPYEAERRRRLLYADAALHLGAVELLFALLLDPRGQLVSGSGPFFPARSAAWK
jgi:hypothetical protein